MDTKSIFLNGLKIAMCQMKIVPGRPDSNGLYIIDEIKKAAVNGVDVIIFPEMAVPGYFIGDKWEDVAFIHDCEYYNKAIVRATSSSITAIWGSVYVPRNELGQPETGEDGRLQRWNAGFIAQGGQLLSNGILPVAVKALMPEYRFFDDDRHFYSARKIADEHGVLLSQLLKPFPVLIKDQYIFLGVMLCEDMWHIDYLHNPGWYLVGNGAAILINLSWSPWGWQKNRKRHQVVRDLLAICKVPMIYVSGVGVQNNGRNIITCDGSSCAYNQDGKIIFEALPYGSGTSVMDIVSEFSAVENVTTLDNALHFRQSAKARLERLVVTSTSSIEDTVQLYAALWNAIKYMYDNLPPRMRKVVVGLSGGIDSAVVLALMTQVFGRENCIAVNMPSGYNSQLTKDIARKIADSLGVEYLIRPIDEVVDMVAKISEIEPDTIEYENIQSVVRMQFLKAIAAKRGAVFPNNGNKVEAAFGYFTLYGDSAGFMAPIGDLVKGEVRQVADFLNKVIFDCEVIPKVCIDMPPTAELAREQIDPFCYGTLTKRGYHDEMVRAFVEFRKNPEWFLKCYVQGVLESELKLEAGTLQRLFPNGMIDFIADLEKHWEAFHNSFHKRNQMPPIPVVSKRAFGFDLRESMLGVHFTTKYRDMRVSYHTPRDTSVKEQNSVVIYGLSANPPGLHHTKIIKGLLKYTQKVVVIPCGGRPDKVSVNEIENSHRKKMVNMAFGGIPGVSLDFSDLEGESFTPTIDLGVRYQAQYPDANIFYAIGPDIIRGGAVGQSEIHRAWKEGKKVWNDLHFIVVVFSCDELLKEDLPPKAEVLKIEYLTGRSSIIRQRVAERKSWYHLVCHEVGQYIRENNLYQKE